MMTLKNALNIADSLRNDHAGARLELATTWQTAYQQFDAVLRHFDAQGAELYQSATTGFYPTFVAVSAYATAHGFADGWEVVHFLPSFQ